VGSVSFSVTEDREYIPHWTDAADALECLGHLVTRVERFQSQGYSPAQVDRLGGLELKALRSALIARAQAPRSLLERAQLAAAGLILQTPGGKFADEDEVREVKLQLLLAADEDLVMEAIEAKAAVAASVQWAAQVMPMVVPADDSRPTRPQPSPAALAYERARFWRSLAGEE
jgi:hypothetical protein